MVRGMQNGVYSHSFLRRGDFNHWGKEPDWPMRRPALAVPFVWRL